MKFLYPVVLVICKLHSHVNCFKTTFTQPISESFVEYELTHLDPFSNKKLDFLINTRRVNWLHVSILIVGKWQEVRNQSTP